MYIQRILRNAVLAELLLFLMVVNCAPSRPREDVDGSRRIGGAAAAAGRGSAPAVGAFRRIYRFSTGCGSKRHHQQSSEQSITIGDLIRFRPDGSLDAKGLPSDSNVDIQLISVGFGGQVRIYSPSSQLYLCFNKKAKLVTKKKIRADDTLCQFYDTLNHGIRRFVSVYRRRILAGLPAKSDGSSQEDFIPPIPGQNHHHRNNHVSPGGSQEGDWQVGFSRTGEPLKGAGWRKQPACFDLVDRVDHHTTQPTPPLNFQDMLHIFQSEVTTKRSTTTVPTTTLPARRKTNKRRHHRKHPVNHHKVSNPNHQVTTTSVNELIPAEVLWPSKNNLEDDVVSSNRVDFDSYLAETEELIAQAGHPKKEAAADGYVNSSQQHSGGSSSSRFILLDSGGWQEVIIRQPVSPDEQQQQQQDVTL